MDVDRPDRKIKRLFYVNPTALEAAKAGDPLPNGTVLIMEDHPVELEGEAPRRDAEGRFIAKRSEEHTSELQSLMRNSYAVFCLNKKNTHDLLYSDKSYTTTPNA